MHGSLELLSSPEARNAVVTFAIVLTHACAGSGVVLVAVDPMADTTEWRRADRRLLFVALALGLPASAFALLALASSSRDSLVAVREAFGPVLIASAFLPVLWLAAWTARAFARSELIARIAGWTSVVLALLAVAVGSAVAAWCWSPSSWIETRALRSALLSPWIAPMLVARGAAAIAIGGMQ